MPHDLLKLLWFLFVPLPSPVPVPSAIAFLTTNAILILLLIILCAIFPSLQESFGYTRNAVGYLIVCPIIIVAGVWAICAWRTIADLLIGFLWSLAYVFVFTILQYWQRSSAIKHSRSGRHSRQD